MQSRNYTPHPVGWIETQLDEHHIDFLWKKIKESPKKSVKDNLIGNISQSFAIKDSSNFFYKKVLIPHIQRYRNSFGGDPIRNYLFGNVEMCLNGFWCNYQYQTEFNPEHMHDGITSFVIWMKIPTNYEEQHKLPFNSKAASDFQFTYCNILGNVVEYPIYMSPDMEGVLMLFPSSLHHQVYPFFNTEEPRISIAGNLLWNVVECKQA